MSLEYCMFCGDKTVTIEYEIDMKVRDIIELGPPMKLGPPHNATQVTETCLNCGAVFDHYEPNYVNILDEGIK